MPLTADSLAHDLERLARFEREAHLVASLNHPHIAQIFGVEDSTGVPALVIELVDGPTLADRIAKGPIPIEEVALLELSASQDSCSGTPQVVATRVGRPRGPRDIDVLDEAF
jgi:serine/threonine protein kinase